MRKIINLLIFLVFLFLVNLSFYFISEDYQFFIKKLKNKEEITYIQNPSSNELYDSELNVDTPYTFESQDITDDQNNTDTESVEITYISEPPQVVLGKNYQTILELFQSYNLETIELKSNLFDITEEYPDDYYEYYSPELTLYFFDTKSYHEIMSIFDVLAYDLRFTTKQVDNFGDASFFINLNEDIQDNFIRTVVNYKGVVFGLKFKKSEYDTIKKQLFTLK
ncbi:MAG: hypothetical protein GY828_02990 [Candidatus Gracilibacteria bacterium]|nr:hypothetical protein [Candidatus Gracilibacteria bacterium]